MLILETYIVGSIIIVVVVTFFVFGTDILNIDGLTRLLLLLQMLRYNRRWLRWLLLLLLLLLLLTFVLRFPGKLHLNHTAIHYPESIIKFETELEAPIEFDRNQIWIFSSFS